MITREQVKDLQPGDVVEVHMQNWREGVILHGPLHESGLGTLWLGDLQIRYHDGDVFAWSMQKHSTLTVVSRAPRPLYVNSDKTEPDPGDVVREDGADRACVWTYEDPGDYEPWRHILGQACKTHGMRWTPVKRMPTRLRLLVDGRTGQVVR